ncbi:CGNR zinc finger domain-containing protein [Antrihabitans cavernicola]|uniref:CGNR zinc finger domain-containing protein n=1 Tax=Antrihabitans cavernicola TaxID=2495913 RepID=A0A5A7SDZ3_9NOCA|nr:CGNR zinc finger domain-containing protein [Spelaeibacter cavernicola]KAA0023412.1 CGNR zinc finger domain-containing protein [Spelaeibacter cavernicola]
MHLNPYGADAVVLATELVNDPPDDVRALARRCVDAGVVVEVEPTAADFAATHRFLDAWTEVVDAESDAERALLLNRLLARASAYPRLTDHAETGWHIHYRDPDMPLSGVLEALLSVGTALHLTGRGMDRLGRCATAECGRVFADVSRNGRQRYCSPACSNRDAVRRHRARSRG